MRAFLDLCDLRGDIPEGIVQEADFALNLPQLIPFSLPFIAISSPFMTKLPRS
jgi:hypothetical protein